MQQAKEDAGSADENLLDFSVLFEMESLQKALLNIKLERGEREWERESAFTSHDIVWQYKACIHV